MKTKVRKIGGSFMITLPPLIVQIAELKVGSECQVNMSDNKIVINPSAKLEFKLKDLISESDDVNYSNISNEEKNFMRSTSIGLS